MRYTNKIILMNSINFRNTNRSSFWRIITGREKAMGKIRFFQAWKWQCLIAETYAKSSIRYFELMCTLERLSIACRLIISKWIVRSCPFHIYQYHAQLYEVFSYKSIVNFSYKSIINMLHKLRFTRKHYLLKSTIWINFCKYAK